MEVKKHYPPRDAGSKKPFDKDGKKFNKTQKPREPKVRPPAPVKPSSLVYTFELTEPQKQLRARIIEAYPEIFNADSPKPLCSGLQKELLKRLRSAQIPVSCANLKSVLTIWCGSLAYKKAIIQSKHRFDLDGNAVEEVSNQHKLNALQAMQYFIQVHQHKKAVVEKRKAYKKKYKLKKKKEALKKRSLKGESQHSKGVNHVQPDQRQTQRPNSKNYYRAE